MPVTAWRAARLRAMQARQTTRPADRGALLTRNEQERAEAEQRVKAWRSPAAIGLLCGLGAALLWALGFVVALHGVRIGFAPADLALHRFVWPGLMFMPWVLRRHPADLGGVGWGRGFALTLLSGPFAVLMSYAGFTLVPLGHGAVIQPACATLMGLLLATLFLKEPLSVARMFGGLTIVAGLMLLGTEALLTIGRHGLGGDMLFVTAGTFWAMFGTLLRVWRLDSLRAMMAVNIVAVLIFAPFHAAVFGYETIMAMGLKENLIQVAVQGVLAGPLGTYLFAHSTVALGAGRAATFPSLVPVLTVLIGFLLLGQVPTLVQLLGLATVLVGFRFVIRL